MERGNQEQLRDPLRNQGKSQFRLWYDPLARALAFAALLSRVDRVRDREV